MIQDTTPRQHAGGRYIAQAAENGDATVNVTKVYQIVPTPPLDPDFLARAERHFAELPLEYIPEPAPLPGISRVGYRRNPLFVSRESYLRQMANLISQNTVIGVTGIGGMGKTQLVSEFVHRYGQYFDG